MIYVDFRNEVVGKLNEKYGIEGWKIKLYMEGETSSDEAELDFIRQTNIKYFGHDRDVLDGDFIRMDKKCAGGTSVCRFDVRYLYSEFYKKGWEEIFAIADDSIRSSDGTSIPVTSMDEYDEVNNMLIARLLNYEENKESLEGHVFRRVENIAIALYFRVTEDENNLTSFKIPQSFVDKWGIGNDQAIDRALENSSILYPPEIYRSKARVDAEGRREILVMRFDIDKDVLDKMDTLTCTSMNKINGAVVFFYPGMAEKFYKAFGNEDYFVVFTATTEFHLHRCSDFDPAALLRNLRLTNQEFPGEALTDVVYRYYGDKKQLFSVEE